MKKQLGSYSDSDLLLMLKGKKKESEAAFTEIYKRYASRVNAYCSRIIHEKQAAEDIFQDTFCKFYQNVRADLTKGSLIGFLITIARNLCLNYKRDKKSTLPIDEFEFLIHENTSYEDTELVELVKMAMELLEFEYREPLVLRVYNGLNYAEIADICSTSESNARSRVHRAKQKIKKILKPYLTDIKTNEA